MKRLAQLSILILLILITANTVVMADIKSPTSPPNSGQGIWVNVIGNHAILNNTGIGVYLLTKDEYDSYRNDPNKYILQNRGTIPLNFENISPGEYFVGIEIIMDKKKTKNKDISGPFASAGAGQPDPEKTYADDVPLMMSWGLKVVKNDVGFYLRKWYHVTVKPKIISPVVSLYLDKDGTLSDWETFYPPSDQFIINMPGDSLTGFWEALEKNNTSTTEKERVHLIKLLRKGGRVCLPATNSFHVIFVNEEGKLVASAPVGNENEIDIIEPISPIKLELSQTPDKKAPRTSKAQGASILPPFNFQLNGNNEVRIKNPNEFEVSAGLRAGSSGKDFQVAPNGVASVFVPDGKYQIFFVYSNRPGALFQGDDFTLNNNGAEIQIVKVVSGNYGIKRVK